MSVVDPSALPAKVWRGKLAALRSHYASDADERVTRCLDALSYWRFRSQLERETAAGHFSTGFAAAALGHAASVAHLIGDDSTSECGVAQRYNEYGVVYR